MIPSQNKPDQQMTRRKFLQVAGGSLSAIVIASSMVSCSDQTNTDSQPTDLDTPEFIFEKEDDMQPRLLVTYATAAGSTIGVAEVIGKTFASSGMGVDVKPIKNNPNLEGYQGVIIGSAVHGGRWLPEATQFIEDHQTELKQVPVAAFCVHILNLGTDEKSSQKRQAYLEPIRSLIPFEDEAYFAGKGIDPDSASTFEKFMASLMKIPPGDKRDWDQIATWADTLLNSDFAMSH